MPGPNSGLHGLTCVGREGTACTKVVLQSRVRIRRWYHVGYAVILPGRWWCRPWTFSLFSVFCPSACGWVSPFGPLVFVGSFVPGFLRRSRLVASRGSAELVLVVLLFFVLLLVLAAEERFLLPCWVLL